MVHFSTSDGKFNDSLYNPKILDVSIDSTHKVCVGSLFTWTPDPLNAKGFLVITSFFDTIVNELNVNSADYIQYQKWIPDNGSFVMTTDMLNGALVDNWVDINFVRGNYKMAISHTGFNCRMLLYNWSSVSAFRE